MTNSQENNEDFTTIYSAATLIFAICGNIFVLSEFGQLVNNQFEEFDEKFYQCDWYLFPIKTQQMYATFMIYTQDSVMIQGFGNLCFTRDTFEKVSVLVNYSCFVH